MRKNVAILLPLTLAFIVAACATYDGSRIARWESRLAAVPPGAMTPDQLLAEAHVKLDIIPAGTVGRRYYLSLIHISIRSLHCRMIASTAISMPAASVRPMPSSL